MLELLQAWDHTQKKTAHASEQDRPDVLRRREAWFESQIDLDPERLVFIDETWASTAMARRDVLAHFAQGAAAYAAGAARLAHDRRGTRGIGNAGIGICAMASHLRQE